VGVAIGIVISERSFDLVVHQALIVGCFQGLAAGTLLYVTFFEIFQEEGRKLHRKCFHILVAILGFVLMASLEFMGGHNHGDKGHGHSHGSDSQHPLLGINGTTANLTHNHDEPHDSHEHHNHDHDHSH